MGNSLYRSHRPLSFDEIVGQEHIVTTLRNSIEKGRISHAYLLCGPRGTGKTSIARIMAYGVNQQSYTHDSNYLDIIEIDAASNRRIDEIREIRDQVNIAPTSGRYKVYIIDEVHMLTKEAFNALLKTLEEPPAHVIFILATTELNKVPDTIVSRCITLQLKPIDAATLTAHLRGIAKAEKIIINNSALELIAKHGNGSFRDAITVLEQVSHIAEKITATEVYLLLGLASDELLSQLLDELETGNFSSVKAKLDGLLASNINVLKLAGQISDKYRDMLISGRRTRLSSQQVLSLLSELLDVAASSSPQIALELCLFKLVKPEELAQTEAKNTEQIVTPAKDTYPQPKKSLDLASESPIIEKKIKSIVPKLDLRKIPETSELPDGRRTTVSSFDEPIGSPLSESSASASPLIKSDDFEVLRKSSKIEAEKIISSPTATSNNLWLNLLGKLKSANSTIYGITRMAEVQQTDDKLILGFEFNFHYKQVKDSKNLSLITKLLSELTDSPPEVIIELIEKKTSKPKPEKVQEAPTLDTISNIFGELEVVES